MTSKIQNVAKLAQLTFGKCHQEDVFQDYLSKLKNLAAQITQQDVNFNFDLINGLKSRSFFARIKPPAPTTYTGIYENDNFTMGIFALRNQTSIPLHDHPKMHGIIKVIYGTIKVMNYTPLPVEGKYTLPNEIMNLVPEYKRDLLVPTICEGETLLSSDSEQTCALFPNKCNLHQVSSVNGSAAFLDILSPPYNSLDRECHYYSIIATIYDDKLNSNITWLLTEMNEPDEFWSDSAPYLGPKVQI